MAYLDSSNVENLVANIKSLTDINYIKTADIAFVEYSMVATRTYYVDDLVVLNGQLYRVIATISTGATFAIGTNIEETTIENYYLPKELTILDRTQTHVVISHDIFKAYQIGKLVIVNIQFNINPNMSPDSSSFENICKISLPRSLNMAYSVILPPQVGSNSANIRLLVNPDGGVHIMNADTNHKNGSGWYRGTITLIML